MRLHIVVAAASLAVVIGCGSPSTDRPGARPVDWDRPLIDGIVVQHIEEIMVPLAFTPIQPRLPQQPRLIMVDDPDQTGINDRHVVFVYEIPERGIVWIMESKNRTTEDRLIRRVDSPHFAGVYEVATVHGHRALAKTGNRRPGSVEWIDGDIRFMVIGPGIVSSQAREIADGV